MYLSVILCKLNYSLFILNNLRRRNRTFNTTFETSYQVCHTNGSPYKSCQYLTIYV